MRRFLAALAALLALAPAAGCGGGRADPVASTARSRSRRTARSTSPRRSASGSKMSPSTTASTAISRPATTRRDGRRVKVGFELVGTSLDGQSEPNKVETLSNGVRISIGSADRSVPPGEHRYTIRYRATRMIGRFDGYDELYWNVTGNGWDFPIDRATATITLPSPARFGQRAAYTGPQGSTDQSARVTAERPGTIRFEHHPPALFARRADRRGGIPQGRGRRAIGIDPAGLVPRRLGPAAGRARGPGGRARLTFSMPGARRAAIRRPARWCRCSPRPTTCRPRRCATSSSRSSTTALSPPSLVDAAVKGHVRLVEEDGGCLPQQRAADRALDRPDATAARHRPSMALARRTGGAQRDRWSWSRRTMRLSRPPRRR